MVGFSRRPLVLIQVLLLVTWFGLEGAVANDAPAKVEAPKANLVKEGLESAFNTRLADLNKLIADHNLVASQAAGINRTYRIQQSKKQAMKPGAARAALAQRLGGLAIRAKALNAQENNLKEKIKLLKGDLVKTAERATTTAKAAVDDARKERRAAASAIGVQKKALTDANEHTKAVKLKMESAANVPDTLIADTEAAVAELSDRVGKETSTLMDSRKALTQVSERLDSARNTGSAATVTKLQKQQQAASKAAQAAEKKVEASKGALKKLQVMSGMQEARVDVSKSECEKTLEKTIKKCYSAAAKQARQSDAVATILGKGEVSELGSGENAPASSETAEACIAKARSDMKSCTKSTEKQSEVHKSLTKAVESAHAAQISSTQAVETTKVAAAEVKKASALADMAVLGPEHPTGIFVEDHAVYYVDARNKKSLVKYPTLGCEKATVGIKGTAFADAEGDAAYYLSKLASQKACDGPAYQNVADMMVWASCECSGVVDSQNHGSECAQWNKGQAPWCYVNIQCEHPAALSGVEKKADTPETTALRKLIPLDNKRLQTCTPQK